MTMRALLISLAALLLAACASPPQALVAAPSAPRQVIVVGTLSTNACEAAVAPTYSRAITAADVAQARVRAGTLSLPQAQRVADLGRFAQADLDAACPGKQLDPARLRAAQEAVNAMQLILQE